ncbi:hypothetical protein HDU96_003753 [Phlyctochytrium bullatum]|nr:hypothetical protein HDU96_003753 [Phlyctochytrium bullatum]
MVTKSNERKRKVAAEFEALEAKIQDMAIAHVSGFQKAFGDCVAKHKGHLDDLMKDRASVLSKLRAEHAKIEKHVEEFIEDAQRIEKAKAKFEESLTRDLSTCYADIRAVFDPHLEAFPIAPPAPAPPPPTVTPRPARAAKRVRPSYADAGLSDSDAGSSQGGDDVDPDATLVGGAALGVSEDEGRGGEEERETSAVSEVAPPPPPPPVRKPRGGAGKKGGKEEAKGRKGAGKGKGMKEAGGAKGKEGSRVSAMKVSAMNAREELQRIFEQSL